MRRLFPITFVAALGASRARRSLLGLGLVVLLALAPAAVRIPSAVAADPVIMAAGDIACDPADPNFNGGAGTASACRMQATSDLLVAGAPAAVLPLGDNQYEDGALTKYQQSYGPSWGRVKAISRPIPGDGDYGVSGAAGYFDYFNGVGTQTGPAGTRGQGYYSYDIGAWHIIALNTACQKVPGGCGPGSPQEQWLRADLAAHPADCTLAYFHKPRFSSGPDNTTVDAFWRALYAADAEIVLGGDRHMYERFAPQNPDGVIDPDPNKTRGIREFIVGTGGKNLGSIGDVQANSEVRAKTFGVLKLTLHANSYDWSFVPAAGQSFTDSGSTSCSSATPAPTTTTTSSTTTTSTTSTTTTSTTTTTLPPSSQTFTPDKDTFVSAGAPTTNYGGGANLQVRSGARIAFIGFSVQGAAGVPKHAILRLTVGTDTDAGSDDGGAAYRASDGWQETTLTWNSYQATPGLVGSAITGISVGAVSISQTVDFDVTSAVTGDGRYDFAIQSASTNLTKYLSRERGTNGPRLLLQY
jgi:acid phosphatase type 7